MRNLASISILLAFVSFNNACSDASFDALTRGQNPEGTATLGTGNNEEAGNDSKESGEKNSADSKSSGKSDKAQNDEKGKGKGSDQDRDQSQGKSGLCDAKAEGAERIHISQAAGVHNMEKSAAFDLHVAGSENKVNIAAKAGEAGIPSVCAKITGNDNLLTLNISGKVGKLILDVAGNSAAIDVNVPEGASIDAIEIKTRGNEPQISIKGAGNYNCAAAQSDAKEGSLICQK